MGKLFHVDGPIASALSKVINLIILNILWVVCSLPIITFGAAATAVYYNTLRMVQGEEDHMVRSFFRSFAANFKQSTLIWLILLVTGMVIGGDVYVAFFPVPFEIPVALRYVLMAFSVLMALVWFAVLIWVFVLQSRFENPVGQTIKNACLIAVLNLPITLLSLVVIALCVVLALAVGELAPFWGFIGFAGAAWLLSKKYSRVLARFEPAEPAE